MRIACRYAALGERSPHGSFPLYRQDVRVPPPEEDSQEPRFARFHSAPYPLGAGLREGMQASYPHPVSCDIAGIFLRVELEGFWSHYCQDTLEMRAFTVVG